MTSTDLDVIEPGVRAIVQLSNEQLQFIANTEFVPKGLRGNVPAIMACVITGRSLGIDDMAALRTVNVIDGRPSFSAELMVMLVRRAGHSISGEVKAGEAVARGRRRDNGDEMTAAWTLEMASRAGLAGKQNWQKYPEAMLWARAVSQLCRMLFADVFVGGTYTPEELEPDVHPRVEFEDGDELLAAQESLVEGEVDEPAPSTDTDVDGDSPFQPPAGATARPPGVKQASDAQHRRLAVLLKKLNEKRAPGPTQPTWEEWSQTLAYEKYGVASRADLSTTQMSELMDVVEKQLDEESWPF